MAKKTKNQNLGAAQPGGAVNYPPRSVYVASGIAIVQAVAAIAFGIFLAVRNLTGVENDSMVSSAASAEWVGVGTAIYIFICFGFVIVGTVAMLRGARWGRGAVVLQELILACSSFQMMAGGAVALGVTVFLSAAVTLVLLNLVESSVKWAESTFS